eukprot:CAMPEP_0113909308 /NCGR_PEP_ID=MMETSP0780_2-20120614/26762_1 /TAXON_ID=652834 /ORGANISM="Palpitomonas bilix" /LENGTH=1154 /DNA_ID=CAMNT_0000905067 /DNA_START=195 /DNA_END=3659 /DNA_ORIENTATION=- /assembly_acc=CAM_ASM_000599
MKKEAIREALAVYKDAHRAKKPEQRLKLYKQARRMLGVCHSSLESSKEKSELVEKLGEVELALYDLELPEELKASSVLRSDVHVRTDCEDCAEFYHIAERQLSGQSGIHVFKCSKVKKGIGKRNYPRYFAVSREAIYVLKPLERQDFCTLKWWRPLHELERVSFCKGRQDALVFKFKSEYSGEFEDVLEFSAGDSTTVLDTVQNAQQTAPRKRKALARQDSTRSDPPPTKGLLSDDSERSKASDGLAALEMFVQLTPTLSKELIEEGQAARETLDSQLSKYKENGHTDEGMWELLHPIITNAKSALQRLKEALTCSEGGELKTQGEQLADALARSIASYEAEAALKSPPPPSRPHHRLRELKEGEHRRSQSLSGNPHDKLIVDLSRSASLLQNGEAMTPGRAEEAKKHEEKVQHQDFGLDNDVFGAVNSATKPHPSTPAINLIPNIREKLRLSESGDRSPSYRSFSMISTPTRQSMSDMLDLNRSSFDGDAYNARPQVPQASPMAPDASHADEGEKAEQQFQYVCAHSQGLLFEDRRMRIGVKMEIKSQTGFYKLVFHNKCTQPIRITPDIAPSVALEISSLHPMQIGGTQQSTQEFKVVCSQPFLKPPVLHVAYDVEGISSNFNVAIKLPIVISKFCRPLKLDKQQFFSQWKEGSHGEVQAVLPKTTREVDARMVATMLSSAANLELLDNIDKDKKNSVLAAQWCGHKYHPSCLVRIEGSPSAGLYRVTVHSDDATVSEAFFAIICGFMAAAKFTLTAQGKVVARISNSSADRHSSDVDKSRGEEVDHLALKLTEEVTNPLEDKPRLSDSAVPRTEKEVESTSVRKPLPHAQQRRSSLDGSSFHNGSLTNGKTKAENEEDELQTLREIAGEYAIEAADVNFEEMIGKGAFGEVYKAEWDGRVVAAKLLRVLESDAVREIGHEVSTLARLRHPCVVTYWGLMLPDKSCKDGGPGTSPAIILEYMSKGSLFDWLYGVPRHELGWGVRLTLLKDVANGMKHLHGKGIVHRDLKPLNLLLSGTRKHPQLKVADFGVSRNKSTRTHVATLTQAGTPAYMAPEVLEERETFCEKVDQYSFGIIMWELLAGQIPWTGLNMAQIVRKIALDHARPEVPNPLPPGTPDDYVSLMRECWDDDDARRPPFADVAQRVRKMMDSY